jgi:hypothetical protein
MPIERRGKHRSENDHGTRARLASLHWGDTCHRCRQYVDWVFDGDDIAALSRTAYDDGLGGAHNQHDANFITFHRIRNFRELTMQDSAPVERIEEVTVETDDVVAVGYGFRATPFGEGTPAFGNRTYVWKGVPEQFQQGWSFTQTDGGQRGRIFIRAKRDCTVYAATVAGTPGYEMLKWTPLGGATFHYTDKGETRMQLYARGFKAGEQGCVQQCGWTGTVVLLPVSPSSDFSPSHFPVESPG